MKKKKKKIKLKGFLIIIIVLGIISYLVYFFLNRPIKNIYVTGNKLLKEQEIIDYLNLSYYPKLYQISPQNIKQKLLENSLINNVNVTRNIFGKLYIDIQENRILLEEKDGNYVLSNGKITDYQEDIIVPLMINDVDSKIRDKFINKMNLIDQDILIRISEIKYDPIELDEERFLLYMTDGNYVYITLSKIDLINSYNEILPTLEEKKGILYLDSGNHFVIKK